MRHVQSLLLAVDFDPAQAATVAAAIQVAEHLDAEVHVMHIIASYPEQTALWEFQKQHHEEELASLVDQLPQARVRVVPHPVMAGSPGETLLRQAAAIGVDLIILGAGRPSAQGSFQLGAVAEEVLRRATSSVLLVPPAAPASRWQRILCPVDHSDASHAALQLAIRLASIWDAELRVLTVVPLVDPDLADLEESGWNQYQADRQQAWAAEYEWFLNRCDFGDLKWASQIRAGIPHREILGGAAENQADLVVMGSIGRGGLLRTLVGSVTRRVLRELPCAMLVVRDAQITDRMTAEDRNLVELLLAEGDGLLREGSSESALQKFDLVLSHDPFHGLALERRADALERLGRREQAERARRRATAVRQNVARSLSDRA